jgi:hypothetical protein
MSEQSERRHSVSVARHDASAVRHDVSEDRIKPIEDAVRTLNREMGQVLGELRWIRWLLMGVLAAAIGQFLA